MSGEIDITQLTRKRKKKDKKPKKRGYSDYIKTGKLKQKSKGPAKKFTED